MSEQYVDPEERREQGYVPRWEIKQMIAQAITKYDSEICGPRLATMQSSLASMEKLLERVAGGVSVLKWIGGFVGGVLALGSGMYGYARIFHP